MTLLSHLLERLLDLPPAETRDIVIQRDLRVPMADGSILLADLHTARDAGKRPLVLMRSPYGRRNPFLAVLCRPFAERGFSVLMQSCRGTFGSSGELDPFRHERDDGRDTLAWIAEQPWFSGEVVTFGPSYLGFVQWALARGGALLNPESGPQDNRALEARRDVLAYTTSAFERDPDVIGPVSAELFVRSSLEHTDFFVRLCDVDPSGKSINLCDGILRVIPGRPAPLPDGTLALTLELWPTAHRFRRGHRMRVQVSSGAHPRFARNPGSGEPLATATNLIVAHQTVHHDPERPSAIVLSVLD